MSLDENKIRVNAHSGGCDNEMPEPDQSRSHDASSSTDCKDVEPVITTWMTLAATRHRCWVKVELAVFLAVLGQAFSSTVITQLLLVWNCQTMFPLNVTKCDLLVYKINTQEAQQLEKLLEPYITTLQMYKTIIEACIPAILLLFMGPWSDCHGRKALILWPLLGHALMYIIYIFLSVVPGLYPLYFLVASIPVALTGGLVTVISGIYAYLSDTTTADTRAFRMGMMHVSLFGGFVVGNYLSAPVFSIAGRFGYLTVFATSATCFLLGFLYVTFIPESVIVNPTGGFCGGFCSLFEVHLIKKMIATCCKRREHYRRAILFLLIIILSTSIMTVEGESAISFLYTRERFGWDIRKYTQFGTITSLVSICGTVIGMYIFSMWLRIPDSVFAMCVFVTSCAEKIIFSLAPKDWYLYIGCAVGIFGYVSGPLCHSIVSKTVPLEDVGAVFALTSALEALMPIAASPLYTFVYNATLLTFPGTFFIMSAAIFAVDAILLSCVIVLQCTSLAHDYTQIQAPE